MGDLGKVVVGPGGRAKFRLKDTLIKVWDVIGRSVVVASDAAGKVKFDIFAHN